MRGWKHSLSNSEKGSFENNSYSFIPGHDLSLFHTRSFGDLAILICFDLMRIETLSFLKGSIHHLFVPAYNRDLETFKGLAETIVKTCFSNVVIANTGEYGGSVARAPYYDNHLREVATVMGNRLFEALVFDLPVESLARYRKHDSNFDNSISDKNKDLYNGGKGRIFKSLPPDFNDRSSFSSSD